MRREGRRPCSADLGVKRKAGAWAEGPPGKSGPDWERRREALSSETRGRPTGGRAPQVNGALRPIRYSDRGQLTVKALFKRLSQSLLGIFARDVG